MKKTKRINKSRKSLIYNTQVLFLVLVLIISNALIGCRRIPKGAGNDISLTEGYSENETKSISDKDYGIITGDVTNKKAFVIWTYNEELKLILENVYKEINEKNYNRIVVVNVNDSDSYIGKIENILNDKDNEYYPDMVVLNHLGAIKLRDDERILPLNKVNISETDLENGFSYLRNLGNSDDGVEKIAFYQANPGMINLRADLCAKYLKTTEPSEIQERYFSSWKKIEETAKNIYEESGHKCRLFAGYEELYDIMDGGKNNKWLDENGDVVYDTEYNEFENAVINMKNDKCLYNTEVWTEEWKSLMEGDGVTTDAALCYVGSPVFSKWLLPSETFKDNTILIPGPEYFFLDSQGVAVTEHCSDKKLAGKLIKSLIADEEDVKKIYDYNATFVNNTAVLEELLASKKLSSNDNIYSYSNENYIKLYKRVAENVSSEGKGEYDAEIKRLYFNILNEYGEKYKDSEEINDALKTDIGSMLGRMKS